MTNFGGIPQKLKREGSPLDKAIGALSKVTRGTKSQLHFGSIRPKRHLSGAAGRRVTPAQRTRWAKVRATKKAA
jgi:hypothetical protein